MAVTIPSPDNALHPTDMAPGLYPRPEGIDTSGLARGVQALGQGVERLGAGLYQNAETQRNQQNVVDAANAEAAYAKGLVGLDGKLSQNNDYTSITGLADDGSKETLDNAAALIRDPKTQEAWKARTEVDRIKYVGTVQTRAIGLKHDADTATFSDALDSQMDMATDPSLAPDQRQKAFDTGIASLERAKGSNLITPADYITMRDKFIKVLSKGSRSTSIRQWRLRTLSRPLPM